MSQKLQSTPGQRSSEGHYRTEQPPADIADSILINPWTAALMQGDAAIPQLYSNSLALTRLGLGSWAPGPDDADFVPKPSLQAFSNPQPAPERDTATLCSAETDAASTHGAHEHHDHDEHHDGDSDREPTDSCSDMSREDAGPADHNRQSDDDVCHNRPGAAQAGQHQSKPGGAVQLSPASSVSGSQHAAAQISSSSDRGSNPTASGADAPQAQVPASHTDWAAAFTNKQGEQAAGLGQHGAAAKGEDDKGAESRTHFSRGNIQGMISPCLKPQYTHGQLWLQPVSGAGLARVLRGYTSWLGDFGHLEGPRFSKQQGKAWQAHMRSQRDQPANLSETPQAAADVGHCHCFASMQAFAVRCALLSTGLHQGGMKLDVV